MDLLDAAAFIYIADKIIGDRKSTPVLLYRPVPAKAPVKATVKSDNKPSFLSRLLPTMLPPRIKSRSELGY